jgi:polysaccharide export outer membrane protein
MQGISLAGGLGIFAAKQRIQVRRKVNGSDAIFVFNYLAFEGGTNLTDNIDLRAGDVIIVPERGFFE